MTTIAALLRAQIEDVWGRGRVELVDTLYDPAVVDLKPVPGQPSGRDARKAVVLGFRAALPDLVMQLHGTLAAGDHGVDFWTLEGTHAPSGRKVRISGIDMVRVAGGRIVDLWHVEEMLQFNAQLGIADTRPAAAGPPFPHGPTWTPDPTALDGRERRNLGLARRRLEDLWASGRLQLIDEIYMPDVIDMNPAPGQRAGIQGIADALRTLCTAAPDLRRHVDAYVPAGDLVADRWTMTGTHTGAPLFGIRATGRRFQIAGMDVARFRADGRIDRIWHVEEFAQLRAQIA